MRKLAFTSTAALFAAPAFAQAAPITAEQLADLTSTITAIGGVIVSLALLSIGFMVAKKWIRKAA